MPHVGHALLKQLEMQKQLHDQLIAQRRLQTAIEEHGKYLASIFSAGSLRQDQAARGRPRRRRRRRRVSSAVDVPFRIRSLKLSTHLSAIVEVARASRVPRVSSPARGVVPTLVACENNTPPRRIPLASPHTVTSRS